ncbi:DUF4350 domain-containing protein [Thermococcus sp. 21S7]|uniref:DUF4350 domain-containing protein n=1 Tax=Thermococcus sp. 21S7 TaxID=1638221 RepID=UPI0014395858|nr:DUF4350 domain-containing protein [Thermococcus sp. 21S7]NJE62128.1 DUF4350 domain-containing protein [Thermococcus sp. 21S7]
MNKTVKYLILLLLIFTFITMPLTVPLFKSSTPYSMFNSDWDGTSKFAKLAYHEGKKVIPLLGTFDTTNISKLNGVLMIIGPNMTFTSAETEQIRLFLERGNTLLIADDFGTGNELLKALNVTARISKYPLRDFFYEGDDRLIVSVRIEDPFLARNVTKIVTNDPSAILVTRKGETYASKMAMVNFHRRMFPIMTEVRYGEGKIIIISDPDILINQLYDENEPFLRNLIEYLGADTFYFDEAHHPDFNLYTAGTITITRFLPREKALKLILIVATLILLQEIGVFTALWRVMWRYLSRFFRKTESPEELALILAKERGWDKGEIMEMLERMGD